MLCVQIVERGYFVDWDTSRGRPAEVETSRLERVENVRPVQVGEPQKKVVSVEMPVPAKNLPGQITQADIKHQGLALRNPSMAAIAAGNQNLPLPGTNRGPMQRE